MSPFGLGILCDHVEGSKARSRSPSSIDGTRNRYREDHFHGFERARCQALRQGQCQLQNSMKGAPKEKYKSLETDEQRREYVAHYIMAPDVAVNEGFNRTTVKDEEVNESATQFLTESQLAGPQWLNDAAQARILCASNYLDDRPHELPPLAAEGIKQYEFSWAILRRNTGWCKIAGTSTKSELTPAEYEKVTRDIDNAGLQPHPRKQKLDKVKKVQTEDDKEYKKYNSARTVAVRRLKTEDR